MTQEFQFCKNGPEALRVKTEYFWTPWGPFQTELYDSDEQMQK